jgi:hypothetical protein
MSSQDDSSEQIVLERFQEYVDALESMIGAKGRYLKLPIDNQPSFWIVAFDAVPDAGSTTAFTFGISSVAYESWRFGRPELVINVDSTDDDWWISLGAISARLRGTCPFALGNTLRFGKPLSSESDMSAFLLFWPMILEKDQSQLKLSDRSLNFVQAYPIFESEVEVISRIGAESFFMLDNLDFSDVTRNKVQNPA